MITRHASDTISTTLMATIGNLCNISLRIPTSATTTQNNADARQPGKPCNHFCPGVRPWQSVGPRADGSHRSGRFACRRCQGRRMNTGRRINRGCQLLRTRPSAIGSSSTLISRRSRTPSFRTRSLVRQASDWEDTAYVAAAFNYLEAR